MQTTLGIVGLIVAFSVGTLLGGLTLGITLSILYLIGGIKIFNEYERGVLFTLGRYRGVVGPGLVIIFPVVQYVVKVDLRVRTVDIPPQEVITKDNVSVNVNGVVFFRVIDPTKAVLQVKDYTKATAALAQTTLRDVIGGKQLDELLERREEIAKEVRSIVDEKADEWGVDITEIRIQDIVLPENMKRAMAVQAEAERERRAVIIKAEGELKAAETYAKAAKILASVPGGLTLRTLQTINDISKDPSQKLHFFIPLEVIESWMESKKEEEKKKD